jgi:hypothetical protein
MAPNPGNPLGCSGGLEVPGSNPGAPTGITGLVERDSSSVERVGEQVALGAVDLLDARSHEAGSSNRDTPGRDSQARVGVPQRAKGFGARARWRGRRSQWSDALEIPFSPLDCSECGRGMLTS